MPSLRASLPARERDYDFSNIGKVGRRTGTTLAPRKLDQHGLEEVSGLFSSPKKPSPVKRSIEIADVEEVEKFNHTTPKSQSINFARTPTTHISAPRSTHRNSTARLRSASPKKSGITGTARRSNGLDIMGQNKEDTTQDTIDARNNLTPVTTIKTRASSARPATAAPRRFSPDGTPFGGRALRGPKTVQAVRLSDIQPVARDEDPNDGEAETPSRVHIEPENIEQSKDTEDAVEILGDLEIEEQSILPKTTEGEIMEEDEAVVEEENDDEDEDATFPSPKHNQERQNQPAAANSRLKRRSSAIEEMSNPPSSPVAKRRKGQEVDSSSLNLKQTSQVSQQPVKSKKSQSRPRGRPPLQDKSNNIKISARLEKQVTEAVEKIRARPGGATRTLHLLRRETPNDDTVLRTRTGRLSVKPLAYWRNEKIVFTNPSDNASTGLADGGRFPLNTVSYVHRIDETVVKPNTKKSGKKKTRPKENKRRCNLSADDNDSETDTDDGNDDPDVAGWEVNPGIMTGEMAVWDTEHQVHGSMTETAEIAYSSGAIETNEVKGSSFRFAKLLSTPFFGTGVVDLPPGGVKKVKNSRKMHMTFFVCNGRVTVDVGPPGGEETRFSIGKGGYWQVPRGNNYAILNENSKNARLFFSQACEVHVTMSEE